MSKKNRIKRQKRKDKKLNRRCEPRERRVTTLADPDLRLRALKSCVQTLPPALRQALMSRAGPPEKVTIILLADPTRKLKDGDVEEYPIIAHEGIVAMMAPGAAEKVAVTAATLTRAKQEVAKPAPSANPSSTLIN